MNKYEEAYKLLNNQKLCDPPLEDLGQERGTGGFASTGK